MAAPAAGRKNTRVTFQAPTSSKNTEGVTVVTYGDGVEVDAWVQVETAPSQEQLATAQVMAMVGRTVTAWYCAALAAVTPLWRIVWGSRVLEVQAVENVNELNRELRFVCREVQAV